MVDSVCSDQETDEYPQANLFNRSTCFLVWATLASFWKLSRSVCIRQTINFNEINVSNRYIYYPINTYIRIALISSLIDGFFRINCQPWMHQKGVVDTPLIRLCNGSATALQRYCNGSTTALLSPIYSRPYNRPYERLYIIFINGSMNGSTNGFATALQRLYRWLYKWLYKWLCNVSMNGFMNGFVWICNGFMNGFATAL